MTAADTALQWPGMSVRERAIAYSPSKALPDGDLMPFIQEYIDNSAAAYATLPGVQTIEYGSNQTNSIDFVLPENAGPKPLLIFLHGGYWQELSKKESFFLAPDALARGIAFAAVDYSLAPHAKMDQIVSECLSAVTYLFENAAALNLDPNGFVISGSSAGAHLAAMVCQALPNEYRLKAAVLLSGIYDLEPLVGTYINEPLGLNVEDAQRFSPTRMNLSGFPPTLLAWGEIETDEFKRQSRNLSIQLNTANIPNEALEVAGRNHFDIVTDLANNSPLGRKVADFAFL